MTDNYIGPFTWLNEPDFIVMPGNVYQAIQAEIEALRLRLDEQAAEEQLRQPVLAVADSAPLAPKRPLEAILREIQKMASFDGNHEDRLKQLTNELAQGYPGKEAEAERRMATGRDIHAQLQQIQQAANSEGAHSQTAQARYRAFCKAFPYLRDKADKQLEYGEQARKRRQQEDKLKKSGQQLTTVQARQKPQTETRAPHIAPSRQTITPMPDAPLHAQDIRGLKPAAAWRLVIDESGSHFAEDARQGAQKKSQLGRWVGLLVPENAHRLPALESGWHAVDKGLAEIDRVVQAVLDADVGILGFTVEQLPVTTGERWAAGVLSLIDWVLRLLPVDGPTAIDVQIENRDVFSARMEWPALARDAVRRLAWGYPERAAKIKLDVRIIDKNGSPFNGYVDALAFTWGSPTAPSKARLKASALLGTCFLQGDAEQIMRAWEWLDRGINLRPEDWSRLLAQPDAGVEGGLAATVLQRLGDACRKDTVLWRGFVDEARRHLDSKAISLSALGKQIDWLENCRPSDAETPPRLRLLWLTARLAHANHMGELEQDWEAEMRALGERLLDEDAPLVCWADLHLAVSATNRYDFERASSCLARWFDLPCSVPGLRYWAQAASSRGQHAAFLGAPEKANHFFTVALDAFARLSDERQRQTDSAQTATYRAIAAIDYSDDDDAARQAVQAVIGPFDAAIAQLARSDRDADKYRHHLLLRWLVYRGGEGERAAYLAQRAHWLSAEGHPWPLIQLYRGLLLAKTDRDAACRLAQEAYVIATAEDQGPTVRLIGACCRAVAHSLGAPWPESGAVLKGLDQQLPAAGAHIERLRRYLVAANADTLDMLREVLPFNFH